MLKSIRHLLVNRLKAHKRVPTTNKKFNKILNCSRSQVSLFSVMSANDLKASDGQKDREKTQNKTLLKSPNDKLIYKYIVLENGLKPFLVSDPSYKCNKVSSDGNQSETSDSEAVSSSEYDLTDVSSVGTDSDSEVKTSRQKPRKPSKCWCNDKLAAMAFFVRSGIFAIRRKCKDWHIWSNT